MALAHEGSPNFLSQINDVRPAEEGVTVEVLNRDDRLLLHNTSDKTVLIDGYPEAPYARIEPDGTVSINRNSEAYFINEERDGKVAVPDSVDPEDAPQWEEVQDRPLRVARPPDAPDGRERPRRREGQGRAHRGLSRACGGPHVPNLVETPFGRAELIKIVVFGAIVALGAVNRRRLLPALTSAARAGGSPGRAGLLLLRTLRAELLLGVVALAVTAALAGYAPSVAESTGPYFADAEIGPARMEMTVDPARVGPNEIHMNLFDRKDGGQYDETQEMTVTAELPEKQIDRSELDATKAGPGHYVVSGAALAVAGEWTLEIAARVTEFDEFRAEVQVPIR